MKNKSVLIVDDVQSMRLVVSYTLKTLEITNIDQAANGQQALERLKSKHYDLVISDVEMPIMNGIELLKLIRADDNLKEIPFILVTSVAQQEKIMEAIEQQVSNYVIKPINPDILAKRITAVFASQAKPK